MVDADTIARRLRVLRDYIQKLRRFQAMTLDEIAGDYVIYWAVLRGLQVAIQCVIDVTSHLHTELGLDVEDSYEGVMRGLGAAGVLPKDFAARISSMPKFRNVLVHDYIRVDEHKVYENLQGGLDDFERFIMHITVFLIRNGYLNEQGELLKGES